MILNCRRARCVSSALVSFFVASAWRVAASENAPHAPFAEWANIPDPNELVVRATYQESEAYYFWTGNTRYKADVIKDGEHYGIDINQGYFTFQYGLNPKWAADLSVGYTTVGWRFFSPDKRPQSTTGLMDIGLGLRYQIFHESENNDCPWLPTLTFRAGAVLPGNYNKDFAFAPGDRSTGVEPEILARKHFGWPGFGMYLDGLFRWNHTTANDHYIVSAGFLQQIKRWELTAGYRRLGSVEGDDIQFDPATRTIDYPRSPRENQNSVEAGFSYTARRWNTKMGFYSRTVFGGTNTDKKFWVGGYIEIPLWLNGTD
jgi:hypothetical protein